MSRTSSMECPESVPELLLRAASLTPIWQYALAIWLVMMVFLYNFLEIHIIQDFLHGFQGNPVSLYFNPCSDLYGGVVSKCRILHGRYLVTPWLSSPHFQTSFLNFFGRPPLCNYRRQLFNTPDGGTLAFDWLLPPDVIQGPPHVRNGISKDETNPIVVVVPGLMSDSDSSYIKHLAFGVAKRGWNVVVCNHRGLGGVSLTSDWFYNAGWTEDLRTVVKHFHQEYPKAPLFAVGTSIGANVLVKYLGEDGDSTHIAGAAAICSPWDLLICDRFISRKLVQKLYDRAIASGLQVYAHLHRSIYSRLADWEGITKSRTVRDFDTHATSILGKYETADTYYRHNSSAGYVKHVRVPLLCISALDDPVCTKEAIPWDECRSNKNIVLATTQHGGHLAFFEGIAANDIWWVRAVNEFFSVLHSSPFMHKQKEKESVSSEPQLDQGPYIGFTNDGMVTAMVDEGTSNNTAGNSQQEFNFNSKSTEDTSPDSVQAIEEDTGSQRKPVHDTVQTRLPTHETDGNQDVQDVHDVAPPTKRYLNQISRHSRKSMWLLAYIAMITTWPLLGPALYVIFQKKVRKLLPAWLTK